MSEEDIVEWAEESQNRDLSLSRSCSRFEMLVPHDPVLSRLATELFKKTNDYLQGELSPVQDYYTILEVINRVAITKHADIRYLALNLSKTLREYNITYDNVIKPLLLQIDKIDENVSILEANAYRLDSYTKQMKARFREIQEQ